MYNSECTQVYVCDRHIIGESGDDFDKKILSMANLKTIVKSSLKYDFSMYIFTILNFYN